METTILYWDILGIYWGYTQTSVSRKKELLDLVGGRKGRRRRTTKPKLWSSRMMRSGRRSSFSYLTFRV